MSDDNDVQILAAGLVCPAGDNFADAATAYVSGDLFFAKEKQLVGADGQPPVLAKAMPFETPGDIVARFHDLLRKAHADCLERLGLSEEGRSFALAMTLPQWLHDTYEMESFSQMIREAPLPNALRIHALHGSRAEGLELLNTAFKRVGRGDIDGVFVAAVDSFLSPRLLDRLAFERKILSDHQPYGFVPGEAAVVLFIGRPQAFPRIRPMGRVIACAGRKTEPEETPPPLEGKTLSACFRTALGDEATRDRPIGRLITDLNGNRDRSAEFGFAIANAGKRLADLAADPEAPVSTLGDMGAATGLVLASLALGPQPQNSHEQLPEIGMQSKVENEVAFISVSEPDGLRCAAVIERSGQTEETP